MDIILDNIIFSIQKSGGISVVWYEMVKRLLLKNDDLTFLEYNKSLNNIFRQKLPIDGCKVLYANYAILQVQRYLNPVINNKNPFIFHSSYYRVNENKKAINFTTVHDFTYEYFVPGLKKSIHSIQKKLAIQKSDYIVCISENTKKDLLKFFPNVDSRKIFVIHNGVSDDYFPLPPNTSYKLPFKKHDYLLFVGSRVSYKNFDLVLDIISRTDFNLIIVGAPLTEEEKSYMTKKKIDETKYKCLSNISNQKLNILYNYAFSLIYPSSYEGFGIPVLEAQKAGCPVIAYSNSSIPEIIGLDDTLVLDLEIDSFISKLEILKHKENRAKIVEEGIINSRKYTWESTFDKLYHLYQVAWHTR
ncbi:MAG TPA: glycosyltransferase family 1 protein [Petrimonas sp.]|nr:glycosyltransferase family 1 protein [Petrimonas sp.]